MNKRVKLTGRVIKVWKFPLLLLFVAFLLLNPAARANVRPQSVDEKPFVTNLFSPDADGFRNFSPREKKSGFPFFPASPAEQKKQQSDSDRCIIKESFRVYADRGNDPSLLIYSSFFSDLNRDQKILIPLHTIILISSKTGESTRIRPPPAL